MDSTFVHQGSDSRPQSQMQQHAQARSSHPHSHRPMPFPSELEQGGGFHHVQHHSRHGHDDLSSLAMSAVDVVGFHASELDNFSDVFKSRTSQSIVTAPYRDFGAPAESLLVEQTLLLPDNRASVPTRMLRQDRHQGRRQLPQKRQAESQESVRLEQGNSSASSFPEASISQFDIPDTRTIRAIPGGWDDESGRLSIRLPSDATEAPITTGEEPRQGQDGQKERQGSGHLPMKMVENPPELAWWRQRLFDLENMVVLSQDE